jgi:hypothetical protein
MDRYLPTPARHWLVLSAAALTLVALASCGGGGDDGLSEDDIPTDSVALVDAPVSAPAADIEDGKISQEGFDETLKQAAKRQGLGQAPDPGDQQYTALRDQAMGDLLDVAWILGEAQDRGISVTDREIQRRFEQTRNQSFKSDADYQNFLRQSGFDQDDVDLRVQLQLLSDQIQQQIASDQSTEEYLDAYRSKWTDRTVCLPEVVFERCQNYNPD